MVKQEKREKKKKQPPTSSFPVQLSTHKHINYIYDARYIPQQCQQQVNPKLNLKNEVSTMKQFYKRPKKDIVTNVNKVYLEHKVELTPHPQRRKTPTGGERMANITSRNVSEPT